MNQKIKPTTKLFLTSLMEQKIQDDVGGYSMNFKKSYLSKFNNLQEDDCSKYFGMLGSGKPLAMYIPPECIEAYQKKVKMEKQFEGGAGSGPDEKEAPNEEPGVGTSIFGGAAFGLSRILQPYLSKLKYGTFGRGGKQIKKPTLAGMALGKAGEALLDVSGGEYLAANADDIAFQAQKNLIAGAGSPFFKLQLPIRRDPTTKGDYDYWRRIQFAQTP